MSVNDKGTQTGYCGIRIWLVRISSLTSINVFVLVYHSYLIQYMLSLTERH